MVNEEKLKVIEFKSANNYTVALMSVGNLYGWGSNESGQMGIKSEIGNFCFIYIHNFIFIQKN